MLTITLSDASMDAKLCSTFFLEKCNWPTGRIRLVLLLCFRSLRHVYVYLLERLSIFSTALFGIDLRTKNIVENLLPPQYSIPVCIANLFPKLEKDVKYVDTLFISIP